jgi:hypothetical protein
VHRVVFSAEAEVLLAEAEQVRVAVVVAEQVRLETNAEADALVLNA